MPISDFKKDWRFHCRVGVYIPASSLSLIKVKQHLLNNIV
jgi:hypothetical protein